MQTDSQEELRNSVLSQPEKSIPATPQMSHATLPGTQSSDLKTADMTPPPTTQSSVGARLKDRTPTPTYSSISTPPPTVELVPQDTQKRSAYATTMTQDQMTNAPVEELKNAIIELQGAYQESKMSAAHYKLQYQMLAQESAAALERMAVEASMAQHENDVIHIAEQAKAAATPTQPTIQDGMIPVQKDLYQTMCLEIQHLSKLTSHLRDENRYQEKRIVQQESEIESLLDRTALMRDRIRQNREHINHLRRSAQSNEHVQRTIYSTPSRSTGGQDQFAALLQASEIASQEATRKSSKKSTNARANVTMTPQRYSKQQMFTTPRQHLPAVVPATAPVPRHTNHRATLQAQPLQPLGILKPAKRPLPPRSEDTVSNSDIDSEAETEIIEQDGEVRESQASRAASMMLRTSHEDESRSKPAQSGKLKQSRLFGAVMKPGLEDDRPAKKAKTSSVIGLGIVGARP